MRQIVALQNTRLDPFVLVALKNTRLDPFVRLLLEAASVGKPIITTDTVGCREVVDDGINGFLCKLRSVDDLKAKMEKMLLLPEAERLQMGRNGREKVLRQFDEQIVIERYAQIIERLC